MVLLSLWLSLRGPIWAKIFHYTTLFFLFWFHLVISLTHKALVFLATLSQNLRSLAHLVETCRSLRLICSLRQFVERVNGISCWELLPSSLSNQESASRHFLYAEEFESCPSFSSSFRFWVAFISSPELRPRTPMEVCEVRGSYGPRFFWISQWRWWAGGCASSYHRQEQEGSRYAKKPSSPGS